MTADRVLVVERALSDTVERTTKGRRVRYVPLAQLRPEFAGARRVLSGR